MITRTSALDNNQHYTALKQACCLCGRMNAFLTNVSTNNVLITPYSCAQSHYLDQSVNTRSWKIWGGRRESHIYVSWINLRSLTLTGKALIWTCRKQCGYTFNISVLLKIADPTSLAPVIPVVRRPAGLVSLWMCRHCSGLQGPSVAEFWPLCLPEMVWKFFSGSAPKKERLFNCLPYPHYKFPSSRTGESKLKKLGQSK